MKDNLDLSNFSMLDLFSLEVETQGEVLNDHLLTLETQLQDAPEGTASLTLLEALMRASHSIKGAARIVQIDPAVKIAHVMEDCFMAAMERTITLTPEHIDRLLQGVDFLQSIGQADQDNFSQWLETHQEKAEEIARAITTLMSQPKSDRSENATAIIAPPVVEESPQPTPTPPPEVVPEPEIAAQPPDLILDFPGDETEETAPEFALSLDEVFPQDGEPSVLFSSDPISGNVHFESLLESPVEPKEQVIAWVDDEQDNVTDFSALTSGKLSTEKDDVMPSTSLMAAGSGSSKDRFVRVTTDNLNRLMGLAGESLVEATALVPLSESFFQLKKSQLELSKLLEQFQVRLAKISLNKEIETCLIDLVHKERECRAILNDRLNALEQFSYRSFNLSDRLYREVIATHMRPFEEGVNSFPRMVRDLSRQLNKRVKLEIVGKLTMVDRDILRKLEAPLTQILRNAIDHGIEFPQERISKGKPPEGTIQLEAAHRFGMLSITISDDGKGIALDKLRESIVEKGLVTAEMARLLNESELMEFIFLPNFSTANKVTEISGRGVGLNIAKTMVQEVGGNLQAVSKPGEGISFHFQLPLTLSVIRTLLVEIAGEPYAFPLSRIDQILTLKFDDIYSVENRQYFTLNEQNIGLVRAEQVLELSSNNPPVEPLCVIVVSDQMNRYGLVIDRFLGEKSLVVRPLDPRLGKVQDITGAALLEDGSPILIVDVLDLVRSLDKMLANISISHVKTQKESNWKQAQKHILVVDDSITVREMERKLLENKGYKVDVAVDGMEGWNAVRVGHYDLVISDIDMPRMNGIKLVNNIKSHAHLKSTPVIIVSYKDREEDRLQGLEAGADYYLTKSSFHDDTLINAVIDLIGQEK
ncbi:hybrid sensor histidine kinase/response regulator [Crocosphaera sp. XPORK-15E]|uniref:hybrid sensor histidine kinase/response regulator n=1 Tax=Crocosphaera sp. XPORK-15E TaxID=3110247 RepID=UPI002B1FE628|nr:hybrid sensor histidine kinase/response regulator [Crocosphaera sp. XPORK-15E]MEA5535305.1 hybrid sensor histidine kinase/response regulator [Crocosphaera sp. XPORK-15E]